MALINMVDVDFGPVMPRLHPLTVHRFLKSLGLFSAKVLGISPLLQTANQVARITFSNEAESETFLNQHGGLSHHDLEEKRVQVIIKDPGVQEKFIRIADFPVNVNLDIVKTRLREFGTVLNIRRERYKATEEHDYIECYNGFITVRMTLNQPIPSYLMIGDYKVYVRYSGQLQTCRVCNQTGHLGAQCPKKKAQQVPKEAADKEMDKTRKEKGKEKQQLDYNVEFPPLSVAKRSESVTAREKTTETEKETEVEEVENTGDEITKETGKLGLNKENEQKEAPKNTKKNQAKDVTPIQDTQENAEIPGTEKSSE